MNNETWRETARTIASEAIDYLAPYSLVIMMGLENAKRQLGRAIERGEFVNAKSVYAVLKTSFERDQDGKGKELLEAFVQDSRAYRVQLIELVTQRAIAAPADLGYKLVAITNRWREHKRPLP